ncbi:protein phosphatase 2C domain-containing protein [Lentzea guizhouensis]|uniref:protein phosphatase 2C domain-containing protein n=1 Tax=Lentzea guizhouensis TaxID=1586287 RepID=UPI001473E1A7|nr:protein phosphatase 2C domain-containing protein [Lentzea guizhouensis]
MEGLWKFTHDDSSTEQVAVEIAPAPLSSLGAERETVPDVVGHRCELGPLQLSAASLIGRRHRRNGEVREDTYAFSAGERSCAVAVADGVGSAVNAHIAAEVAAWCAVDDIVHWADTGTSEWNDHCVELVHSTSEAVRQVEDTRTDATTSVVKNNPPATTLAAAALRVADEVTVLSWLTYGDSAVLLLSLADGQWTWLSGRPQELRTSVTPALPGSPDASSCGEVALQPDDVLVLVTDGVSEAVEAMPDEFAAAIVVAVREEDMSAAKFATLLDFDIRGMGDDRTILVVRRTR